MFTVYVDLNYANDFLKLYFEGETWEDLADEEKNKFLLKASFNIDSVQTFKQGFKGKKYIYSQTREFPRDSGLLPEEIKIACCMEALALSNSKLKKRRELIKEGVESLSIGNVSEKYFKESYGNLNIYKNFLVSEDAFKQVSKFLKNKGVFPVI